MPDLGFNWMLITNCVYDNETVCKAMCVYSRWLDENESLNYLKIPMFMSVVHFDLSWCNCLLSGHLEQLAITCPNLQRLNLQYADKCLKSLQDLQAIANYCYNLRVLNLLGIPVSVVENQVQLWEILSDIRLTHLAVDVCVMEPVMANDRDKLIELYQKFVNLIALEFPVSIVIGPCTTCDCAGDKGSLLLPYFPLLEFCIIEDIHPLTVKYIIERCKKLKYFSYFSIRGTLFLPVSCCNLQQLHIEICGADFPMPP